MILPSLSLRFLFLTCIHLDCSSSGYSGTAWGTPVFSLLLFYFMFFIYLWDWCKGWVFLLTWIIKDNFFAKLLMGHFRPWTKWILNLSPSQSHAAYTYRDIKTNLISWQSAWWQWKKRKPELALSWRRLHLRWTWRNRLLDYSLCGVTEMNLTASDFHSYTTCPADSI